MACCPRVRVVCKRPKSATASASYYELKDAVTAPKHHTVKVSVQKEAVCKVVLGKEVIASGLKVGDTRIDKAISSAQDKRAARGCSSEAPVIPAVKAPKAVNYPDVPGEVKDLLKKKVAKLK